MTYSEAWTELKEKMYAAKNELAGMTKVPNCLEQEKHRLESKLEGLNLAIEYMRGIESLLD